MSYITLKLGGEAQEIERCRKIIHQLFEDGLFSIRSGSFTANFDENGEMPTTEIRLVKRRNKILPKISALEQFTIETLPVDNSSIAKPLTNANIGI